MKLCRRCNIEKDEAEFCKCVSKKDGLGSVCRSCNKELCKQHYTRHRKERVLYAMNKAKSARKVIREKLTALKLKIGCQVEGCMEREPCCLDFHHLVDKEMNIFRMAAIPCSWHKLVLELTKCAVVCCNCHRKIHAGIISPILNPISTDIVGA